MKNVLTIATTDSGGGAGIQADLKTFAAHKVFGLSAVSAVSAQNSLEVTHVECLSPVSLQKQLLALAADFDISAIKIGLIGNDENTEVISDFLASYHGPVVIDPVMVSTSGHTFISEKTVSALKRLFSQATLVTPNMPEAAKLSGLAIKTKDDMIKAAEKVKDFGPQAVLLKGGHLENGPKDDLLFDGHQIRWIHGENIETPNTHGTGCTLSSAIAANLALEASLAEAVTKAKHYVEGGLKHSVAPGHGPGCLHHLFDYYEF